MESKIKAESMKKTKMSSIKIHLFFNDNGSDYLISINDKGNINLLGFANEEVKIISQFTITCNEPFIFRNSSHGDVGLLSRDGIYVWSLDQLKLKTTPKRIRINWPSEPLNFIWIDSIDNNQYAVVCENKTILFIQNQEITKSIDYPSKMNFQKLMVHHTKIECDKPSILVSSNSSIFPWVFSLNQVKSWKKQNYFKQYSQSLTGYYLEDEILTTTQNQPFCFSSKLMLVIVFLKKELVVLSIKKHEDKAMFVLNNKLKIAMRQSQIPYSCHIHDVSANLIYAGLQRIGQINPIKLQKSKKSVKQKSSSGGLIKYVYYLRSEEILLICPQSEGESKLYVTRLNDPQ